VKSSSTYLASLTLGATILVGILLSSAASAAESSQKPGHATNVLQAFNYADVTLTGGPVADQAQAAREFYLAVPNDDLLNGFRLRAGLPAPGKPMGGWYDPENFAGGCTFGQLISALARDYANTGDARYKEKVSQMVHGFHEAIGPDGFFFASVKISTNWPCYTYDKNCAGMRDAYLLASNEEALAVLKIMTDWAYKNMPRRKDEWYTLPENFYNCYALTGDKRYLEMAHDYDYSKEYYDPFANGVNAFTPDRHAYSHINSLCSAAKTYEATGDDKYFKTISNAWDFLTGTQMYASGGWGPNERFVPAGQGALAASLSFEQTRWHFHKRDTDYANNFETPCGSYANMNLDRYLLRFTGDPKYADNLERVLYNGMLAALPMQPDGRTFYYSDYHPGAQKQYFPSAWPCCSGTYAEVTADYPLDIYFHDDNGLYVCLFTPSQVQWQHRGQTITVAQTADFLQSDTATFTVHVKKTARFSFNVRVPAWATEPATVSVNGHTTSSTNAPGTFLKISRRWHDGDTVAVTFPKSLRFEAVDAQTPELAALMYGPILLVALANGDVDLHGNKATPAAWIQRQDGASLAFRTDEGQVFRPLYQLRDEHYTTYCRLVPANHDFAKWEKEIAAFERSDLTNSPPTNAILFTGSSGIRKWTTLAQDFPGQPVINRGFGGCEIEDCTHFADRIVFPYQPRAIFLRAGDNDLWAGKSAMDVFLDFKEFVAAVHARLPQVKITYINPNPCPSRWKQADKEKILGNLVTNFCRSNHSVQCIDTFDMVLGPDGKPRPELFLDDRLHFSAQGYQLLTARVQPYLPK